MRAADSEAFAGGGGDELAAPEGSGSPIVEAVRGRLLSRRTKRTDPGGYKSVETLTFHAPRRDVDAAGAPCINRGKYMVSGRFSTRH